MFGFCNVCVPVALVISGNSRPNRYCSIHPESMPATLESLSLRPMKGDYTALRSLWLVSMDAMKQDILVCDNLGSLRGQAQVVVLTAPWFKK
ncbi:hypothetical protein RRG08_008379 [Elysia crispata]|uniref:Uncharacterized protein n=1 Tax=Elysia crispata TaxID=231223 RepID=A0AAE1AYT8_9GAST|nr:hypothetical protein RRG08_008379 [Elysia crispata]